MVNCSSMMRRTPDSIVLVTPTEHGPEYQHLATCFWKNVVISRFLIVGKMLQALADSP